MLNFKATTRDFSLHELPAGVSSVDIFFDDNRVWSIDTRDRGPTFTIDWPEALVPHLKGFTLLSVKDSASAKTLASAEIVFSADSFRTKVVDSSGVPLSVNKWGRLGRALDAIGSDIQNIILERTKEIVSVLTAMGKKPFIVGGTLLGAVRDGKLLPHDDDADIAYLSDHTSPVDVAIEGYRVGREFEKRGYKLMRHSATHMQLHFIHDETKTPYYIDVFGAFFTDDGHINQPFHVRGKMSRDQMLPFGMVEIDGRKFPTPADTEHWLTINYDADWRTPIPGYDLNTPDSTNRRFFNWFGSFNHLRHFWNDFYEKETSGKSEWDAGALWIQSISFSLTSPQLVDLGCGGDPVGFKLLLPREEIIATDFAAKPLELAKSLAVPGQRTAHLNLFRLNTVSAPQRLGIKGSFDVIANHLLDQTVREAREGAYRMFYMALLSGGSATATFFSKPDPAVHAEDPTLWHLSPHQLATEALKYGLGVTFEKIDSADTYTLSRAPYAAIFNLSKKVFNLPKEQLTMKQRIARFLDTFTFGKAQKEIADLKKQVIDLQDELDEYRGLSSRVAQLTDMLEEQLQNEQK